MTTSKTMEPIKVIVASTKATWLAKLVFRGIAAVIAIALIGIVSSVAAQSSYDDYYYSYTDGYIPLAVIGAQVCPDEHASPLTSALLSWERRC